MKLVYGYGLGFVLLVVGLGFFVVLLCYLFFPPNQSKCLFVNVYLVG